MNYFYLLYLCAFMFIAGIAALLNIIKHKKLTVINHSELIKNLTSLNEKIKSDFYYDIDDTYYKIYFCNSKQKYDKYNTDNYFFDVVYEDIKYYDSVIEHVINNQKVNFKYINQYNKLTSTISAEECKQLKVSLRFYKKIEHKYYVKNKLNPVLDIHMICKIEYTSPKGRNHYCKSSTYGFLELQDTLNKAKLQLEYDTSKEARKQFERNKLTKAMRYDVLRRDNFRCVICGKSSQDGSLLHVDHIIPIAKGGKTELNNLRTLCSDCNLGKGIKE